MTVQLPCDHVPRPCPGARRGRRGPLDARRRRSVGSRGAAHAPRLTPAAACGQEVVLVEVRPEVLLAPHHVAPDRVEVRSGRREGRVVPEGIPERDRHVGRGGGGGHLLSEFTGIYGSFSATRSTFESSELCDIFEWVVLVSATFP